MANPSADNQLPRLLFLVTLLLATPGFIALGSAGEFTGLSTDSAIYLLMADYYGRAMPHDSVVQYVHQVGQFPHAYPMLLGWGGGGSGRLAVAHLLQTLCLLVGLTVSARLVWRLTDSAAAGLVSLWLLLLMPWTLLASTEIWSEFAYLAFASAALLLTLAAGGRLRRWWLAALLVGAAVALRSVGITLLAAFVIALLVHAPRRAWPALLLALLPPALLATRGHGGAAQYLALWLQQSQGSSGFVAGVATNAVSLWQGWLRLFALRPGFGVTLSGAVALVLASCGWWQRLRRLGVDALYAAAMLLLLLIWPFPDFMERLIYPLAPLLIAFAVLGWQQLLRWLRPEPPQWLVALPVLALLLGVLPDAGRIIARFAVVTPPAVPGARSSRYWLAPTTVSEAVAEVEFRRALIAFMQQAGTMVPATDCIYSLHPGQVMYFTRRVSFPAPAAAGRTPLPRCRYHLVLGDALYERGVASFWPSRELVLKVPAGDSIAGVLVRYPRVLGDPTLGQPIPGEPNRGEPEPGSASDAAVAPPRSGP